MKHTEKDRNVDKARKRAKNDARTAIRKLASWAEETGEFELATELATMGARIAVIAELLSSD